MEVPETESLGRLLEQGVSHFGAHDYAGARYCFEQSVAAARRTGDRTSEARALANLGAAFAAAGHDRDAVGPFQASLAAFRRLADRPREEATLCNAIPVMIKVGMVHEAMAAVQRLLEIAEQPQRRAAAYAWEQQLRSRTPPPASSRPPLPRMPRKWMELGFRDLPHSDVMARAEQGRRCLEEVLSVLSKHAAATEKHAELLEKAAKRVEAGPGSSVETLDLAVAAMAAQLQHAVADEREAATVVTTAVCSGMGELKAAHGAQLKQVSADASRLLRDAKIAHDRLIRARQQLDRVKREEASMREKLESMLAASASVGTGHSSPSPADGLPHSAVQPRDAQDAQRQERLQQKWEAQLQRVISAQEIVDSCAAAFRAAARERDEGLVMVGDRVEEMEEERVDHIRCMLSLYCKASAPLAAPRRAGCSLHERKQIQRQLLHARLRHMEELECALGNVNAASDLRIFTHQARMQAWMAGDDKYFPAPPELCAEHIAQESTGIAPSPAVGGAMDAMSAVAAMGPSVSDNAGIPRAAVAGTEGLPRLVRADSDLPPDWVDAASAASPSEAESSGAAVSAREVDAAVAAAVAAVFAGEGIAGPDGRETAAWDADSGTPFVLASPPAHGAASTHTPPAPSSPTGSDGGRTISVEQLSRLHELPFALARRAFASAAVRRAFLQAVNQQRSVNTSVGRGFDRLASLMQALLDACSEQRDVRNAKLAMVLSETFSRAAALSAHGKAGQHAARAVMAASEARGEREFLQQHILAHPLWQSEDYWEEAFLTSVRDTSAKNLTLDMSPEEQARSGAPASKGSAASALSTKLGGWMNAMVGEGPAGLAAVADVSASELAVECSRGGDSSAKAAPRVRRASHEVRYAYRNIVFGQLGSFAHNMLQFGVPLETTLRFIRRMSAACGLTDEEVAALAANASELAARRAAKGTGGPAGEAIADAAHLAEGQG